MLEAQASWRVCGVLDAPDPPRLSTGVGLREHHDPSDYQIRDRHVVESHDGVHGISGHSAHGGRDFLRTPVAHNVLGAAEEGLRCFDPWLPRPLDSRHLMGQKIRKEMTSEPNHRAALDAGSAVGYILNVMGPPRVSAGR